MFAMTYSYDRARTGRRIQARRMALETGRAGKTDLDWLEHLAGTAKMELQYVFQPGSGVQAAVQGRRITVNLGGAGYAFGAAVHDLKKQGCDMAVLGCTELSLVKRDEHLGAFFIDSTEVLCRHALQACGVEPVGF